jgi:hypothetical protein
MNEEVSPMPEVHFAIDRETGELSITVRGIAGPACDDVAKLAREFLGEPSRDERTAEYRAVARVKPRARTRGNPAAG